MQAAFNGESNAHVRYLAFAKQADGEGYGEAASLFRAAARAEEVHASNHAAVIKEMGATPKATIESPEVKSTRENLEAAIKGETYERDIMYPAFLKQA
ncbi:MAG: rubrerythrin family protein [Acidobacteriaceae bacterium]